MKKLNRFIAILMLISISGLSIYPNNNIAVGSAKISGEVTNVRHDTAKAAVGDVRFKLIGGQEGEPFFGYGKAEITFGKNKKIIKKMVIRFKGERNGKRVNGVLKTVKPISFSSPIGTSFQFSQVIVLGEGASTI